MQLFSISSSDPELPRCPQPKAEVRDSGRHTTNAAIRGQHPTEQWRGASWRAQFAEKARLDPYGFFSYDSAAEETEARR